MKLEDHFYLIKRKDGVYFIGKPIYEEGKLDGWLCQDGGAHPYWEDDDIIGSIERIEERKWARRQLEKKFLKENPEIKL